jgi:hypothetical protein
MMPPFNYSHHCGVFYDNCLIFYGGARSYSGQMTKYDRDLVRTWNEERHCVNILNLDTNRWSKGPIIEEPRDDFAWTLD